MNHEQLSFFNHQLAAMLKSGLPLESSLRQLSASMSRGPLRDEIQKLEADLEQGVPLEEALGRRTLPELYVAMLRAGLKGNDLPGVLTLAADYYGHLHTTWLRLKGMMVYPGIVLVTSLSSDKDRARGLEAGADAYIVKSGFDRSGLLEAVGQLL